MQSINSFKTLSHFSLNGVRYNFFSLNHLEKNGFKNISQLPISLKILLENVLRHEGDKTKKEIHALHGWLEHKKSTQEISYRPVRVLLQDLTGVPAIVDLAAMREALKKLKQDPSKINPYTSVDLVIDHSIQVDDFGNKNALDKNAHQEMRRNRERYSFLRWGQKAFANFRVVPPDTGICHQINLEFLAKTIWQHQKDGQHFAYPDTVVGTDSHTTMVNGLGVLGWGVGGIEAEAAMLGQPISMLIPEVLGVKLTHALPEGATATDLVLTLTELLRKKGVVGKFVEFFGPALSSLSVADRATLANMAPEYGATCGFFPIDSATLAYLRLTGRSPHEVALVEHYAKLQGLWHDSHAEPLFSDQIELNLSLIKPSIAGPKRPQDRIELSQIKQSFSTFLSEKSSTPDTTSLHHGAVVIAAITSCTNTSNPNVLMAAGLLARSAVEKGLTTKPWVKTSLAPGSQVVTEYLRASGLQHYLDALGFNTVGYGCTTCIGNSGPLSETVSKAIAAHDVVVSAVLSGNRNFEGRIHPQVKANWLASPPLVVAFALAGTVCIDLERDAIGKDQQGQPVYLKDIWPTNAEIQQEISKITHNMFKEKYENVFVGSDNWQTIPTSDDQTYQWQNDSTYIQHPPFFSDLTLGTKPLSDIKNARILALFGDSITTDHISPAGSIKADSPAGKYLQSKGVSIADFNSYGARRGNHEVMMRGTFANIRIRNEMVPELEGGFTRCYPSEEVMTIYDAAMRYQQESTPLIVIAGKEYGTGSSRDWAAKGPKLLGVKAVIAESFERIHRTNLIGMGVLPLQFTNGMSRKTLNLTGNETITLLHLEKNLKPLAEVTAMINNNGINKEIKVLARIETTKELAYFRHGGILEYVLSKIAGNS